MKKARQLVADHSGGGDWDLIVTPWHLDEHIPAFPIPASVVRAACIACAWLPDHIGDQHTRETIARLASALGTDLTWA